MKFTMTKYGLKSDPRGAHVTMQWKGRILLGEVTSAWRDEVTGAIRLSVRHFNGEPWSIEPTALSVDVLERTYGNAWDRAASGIDSKTCDKLNTALRKVWGMQ